MSLGTGPAACSWIPGDGCFFDRFRSVWYAHPTDLATGDR